MIKRLEEEKNWTEKHEKQKQEAELRIAKLQLVDEARMSQMKQKDE